MSNETSGEEERVDQFVPTNINQKFSLFTEHWRPKVVGQMNGQEVKLVKFKGEFVWHHHDNVDEFFMAWKGKFRIDFRDRSVELKAGEFFVVPRGVEHRPVAEEEVEAILIETVDTRNSGNIVDDVYTAPSGISV